MAKINSYNLLSSLLHEQVEQSDWTQDPEIKQVVDFLISNPNPPDEDVHSFSDQLGIDTHRLESVFYFLATKTAKLLKEGRSIEKGISEQEVDPNELKMGIEVESEHINCPAIQKKIALDHLAEMSDYYTKLKQMEGGNESEGE